MNHEPNTQERIIVQNVTEIGRFRDVLPGDQSCCSVLKKNSVHKTNLARLGTNLEAAHLKKLEAFIRTHRIDAGKLEFKERLALQWVESKGTSSALDRRGRGSPGLSSQKGFFQGSDARVEPSVSRFVPHFPQNKKFVFEVMPQRELSDCRLPDLPDRHQEPQIITSFSQETLPMESLFIPVAGQKPSQEAVKIMSNLWDLRKQKQTDCYVDGNGTKTQPWNFKVSK
ncbi:hypothetical protein GE061_013402 [Apolygus lucorum]|uniref:Uncharacterized protein n=1 Tax=Apolygus lucorum TaxID=248454 RepID=A0A6A4JW27_APOLU|nr:hypothetical protein GE061_013402 [Apolygus lucorum]